MRISPRHLSRRAGARALALAAAGGAVASLGVAAPAADGAAHAAATPACKTAQLVVWLNTQSNGAAGTIFYTLNFTNLGGTCTLRGYPGVSAVALGGHTLGSAARRNNGVKVKTITLKSAKTNPFAKGATAHTTIGIVDTGALPTSSCHPTTAAGLRVFPPNQKASAFVPFPFSGCSGTGSSFLTVRAVS